ncbi:MAG: PAS domain S-box protein [Deltaproteobacteria bacterium]|nr:PAS domain S-box protein [Deltaproteobacteria bacterium]
MKKAELTAQLEQLKARLGEVEETLEAIRTGQVDAVVVAGPDGDQVYTLRGADYSSRMLLQEMNEGAATLMPDGTILYCNRRLADMLKLPLEKAIGSSITSFVPPADQPTIEQMLRQGQQETIKAEIKLKPADGPLAPVYCSVSPVQIDEMLCIGLIATDLTEQKRVEEIVAAGQLARCILEQATDAIIVCDQNGGVTMANAAAEELSGGPLLHRNCEELFPLKIGQGFTLNSPCERHPEKPCLCAPLRGETLRAFDVQMERPDGKVFDLLLSGGPVRDSQERLLGTVVTLTDITERKRAERALQESEHQLRRQSEELEQQLIASGRLVSIGEITASMAHEFNNPLSIIMGFTQDLLSEMETSHPSHQFLKIIEQESQRCQNIIRDLLEYARPQSSQPRSTNIKELIGNTLNRIRSRLNQQKVKTVQEIRPDLPQVHADPQQLEQVLLNLFFNALDAMPGGGKLIVRADAVTGTREGEKQDETVTITVEDTGIGIHPDDLDQIFRPFFTSKKSRGLGLGLSVCARIIKNHGGKIGVESRPGKGTAFRIYLPVQDSAREESPEPVAPFLS